MTTEITIGARCETCASHMPLKITLGSDSSVSLAEPAASKPLAAAVVSSPNGFVFRGGAEDFTTSNFSSHAKLERLLVAHQLINSRRCCCGWDELGKSHAAHIIAEMKKEGFLPYGQATDGSPIFTQG